MALSGIRDMSVIEEAPRDRHPVQTYVLEHDDGILFDAIRREIRRGGQVYVLHNDVASIERVASRIQAAVPESRVGFGPRQDERAGALRDLAQDARARDRRARVHHHHRDGRGRARTRTRSSSTTRTASASRSCTRSAAASGARAAAPTPISRSRATRCSPTWPRSGSRPSASSRSSAPASRSPCATSKSAARATFWAASSTATWRPWATISISSCSARRSAARRARTCSRSTRAASSTCRSRAHIPESYISDLNQRLEIYRRIADVRTRDDALDVTDELIDRFGEPPQSVNGLIEIALLRQPRRIALASRR